MGLNEAMLIYQDVNINSSGFMFNSLPNLFYNKGYRYNIVPGFERQQQNMKHVKNNLFFMKTTIYYNRPVNSFNNGLQACSIPEVSGLNQWVSEYCNTCLRNAGLNKGIVRNTWYAAKEYPVLDEGYRRSSKRQKSKSQ